MDQTAGGEEEKVKRKPNSLTLAISTEKAVLLDRLMKAVDESHKQAMEAIKKDAHSFFSNKQTLFYIYNLVEVSHEVGKWALLSMFSIELAHTKIANLEKIVETMTQKLDIDLKGVKSEVESLKTTLDLPMIANVNDFIEKMKENIEKNEKKVQEYVQ